MAPDRRPNRAALSAATPDAAPPARGGAATAAAWRGALWAAFAVALALRVHNAFAYPTFFGFDVGYNWEYVERLCASWSLPRPDEGWSFAHPPLFYALAALVGRALGCEDPTRVVIALRLLSSAVGLAAVAAVVALVRRVDPGNERREFLAGALLLFLPAQVQMSASFGEEILAAAFATGAVVWTALALRTEQPPGREALDAAGIGALAGLAWLTKLTGALSAAAIAAAFALEGWRSGRVRRGLASALVAGLLAACVGGWFYARNQVRYGYLYPHDLAVHAEMHRQLPGKRTLLDYVYVPAATFTNPVVTPALLRSIWGGTHATLWFDGHRHFLPKRDEAVRSVASLVSLLALLPTAAFFVGVGAGLRRTLAGRAPVDTPLLLVFAATLAGYVLFTFRNPWWSTVKGTYLLGAMAPFAFYASEALARWTARPGARAAAVWGALALLAALISLSFCYGLVWAGGGP